LASIELTFTQGEREERKLSREGGRGGRQQMRVVLSAKLRAIYHYQTLAAETFHMTSNVSGVSK